MRLERVAIVAVGLVLATGGLPAAGASANSAGTDEAPPPASSAQQNTGALGELLVYYDDAHAFFGFTELAEAAQLSLETEFSSLPQDLGSYECVVLPLNTSFSSQERAQLAQYVQGGGQVLAIGEWSWYEAGENDAMNALADTVGSSLFLEDAAKDLGFHDTDNLPLTTMTATALEIRYAAYSIVRGTSTPTAPPLAIGQDGATALIASEQIGLGTFTLTGDVNVLSDYSGDGYDEADNDDLARGVCHGPVSLGVPV